MGDEPATNPAGFDRFGSKYRIVRELGGGGMGVVYEAEHIRLRQRVAIKTLQPHIAESPAVLERFEREARAAAALKSPFAARVVDVEVGAGGVPFMVMEFLEGNDLAAEIARRGPLPVVEAVTWVMQACQAMSEAHGLGIVHRDLKPANLFLTTVDGQRVAKVLDFGISKLSADQEASVTATFSALGTALYMSPEQVRSAKHVDARTDVWSLGVVLYEALTARLPFLGDSVPAVIASIVADAPAPPRAHRPDLPPALEAVVLAAMEKDRERRIPSVRALAQALAPFAGAGLPTDSRASWPALQLTPPGTAPAMTAIGWGEQGSGAQPVPAPAAPSARRWVPLAAGGVGLGTLALGAALFLGRGGKVQAEPAAASVAAASVASPPTVAPIPAAPPSSTGVSIADLPVEPVASAAPSARPAAAAPRPAARPSTPKPARPSFL